ncbi:MAG: TonB family protein [Pseudomonadales bacterium]|nr:TonB family protein [Pseudomonadales bacterium]
MSDTISYFSSDQDNAGSLFHSFGIAALFVVLGVITTWFFVNHDQAPLEFTIEQITVPDAAPVIGTDVSLTLLEQAELAFAAGRIIEPEYDNALGYYQSLLQGDIGNQDALGGLKKVKSYLLTQADSAVYQNDWDAARSFTRVILSIDPTNSLALQVKSQTVRLESIEKLSRQAVSLMAKGDMIAPASNNAVKSYRAILNLDPDNVLALEGVRSVSQRLLASAQTAIFAGKVKEAKRLISQATVVDSKAPGIKEAEKLAAEWQQVLQSRDVQQDLAKASEAIKANHLIEPAAGSAFSLYRKVLSKNSKSIAAQRGIELVQKLLIDRASSELNASDLEGGEKAILLALKAGASKEMLANIESDMEYRRRVLDAKEGVFDRVYVLSELEVLHQESPKYPRTAMLRDQIGWVELEFTITEVGEIRDAIVTSSSTDMFERNALVALNKWRFEPMIEAGHAVPVRAALKFNFR